MRPGNSNHQRQCSPHLPRVSLPPSTRRPQVNALEFLTQRIHRPRVWGLNGDLGGNRRANVVQRVEAGNPWRQGPPSRARCWRCRALLLLLLRRRRLLIAGTVCWRGVPWRHMVVHIIPRRRVSLRAEVDSLTCSAGRVGRWRLCLRHRRPAVLRHVLESNLDFWFLGLALGFRSPSLRRKMVRRVDLASIVSDNRAVVPGVMVLVWWRQSRVSPKPVMWWCVSGS